MYRRAGLGFIEPLDFSLFSQGAGDSGGVATGNGGWMDWLDVGAAAAGGYTEAARSSKGGGPDNKQVASAIANAREADMKANLAAFQRGEIGCDAALAEFDRLWDLLKSQCGNSNLGSAGQACISDRDAGGRWPYRVYYRDPIAAGCGVAPSTGGAAARGAAAAARSAELPWLPIALGGAALLTAVVFASSSSQPRRYYGGGN